MSRVKRGTIKKHTKKNIIKNKPIKYQLENIILPVKQPEVINNLAKK